MINFEKHIREMFFEYDFIIIPGFGAFIARFIQPGLDEISGQIINPVKQFEFTEIINEDDSKKFLNYLVKAESLPISEIELQLKEFLFNFKKELNATGKAELKSIGQFIKSKEGTLKADLKGTVNYYDNTVLSEIPEIPKLILDQGSDILVESREVNLDESEAISEIEEETIEAETRSPIWKYLLYFMPILVLLGALYYTLIYLPEQKKLQSDQPKHVEKARIEEPIVDSTLIDSSDIVPLVLTKPDSEAISVPKQEDISLKLAVEPKKENATSKISDRFQVWAGLFRQKANATKVYNLLKRNRLNAKIEMIGRNRRVYVPVSTEKEAQEMVKTIEQLTGEKAVYFEK